MRRSTPFVHLHATVSSHRARTVGRGERCVVGTALLLAIFVASGCASDPTELVVLVDGDDGVRGRATSVRLVAREPDGSRSWGERTIDLGRETGLPVRFALRASDGQESSQVELEVVGLDGASGFVRRLVRARYQPESIGLVRVRLTDGCIDRCDAAQDCDDGRCGPPVEVPAEPVDRDAIPPRGQPRDAAFDAHGDSGAADADLDARLPDIGRADADDAEVADLGADAALDGSSMDLGSRDMGGDIGPPRDMGAGDTGVVDTGTVDMGIVDMSVVDMAGVDTGTVDMGIHDMSIGDTGPVDTGPPDTGPIDMGPSCIPIGPEVCNGIDDDCNGTIDVIDATSCTTSMPGECAPGTNRCVGTVMMCVALATPTSETCNGRDDDCNGMTDDPPGSALDCSGGRLCIAGACVGVRSVAGGVAHSCAVLASGTTWCWGRNLLGQLGNGTGDGLPATVPVAVVGAPTGGFVEVVAGQDHTCGRTASGAVWCWGSNVASQLATFVGPLSGAPVLVSLPGVATAIDAGDNHTCAIVAGVPYCWGSNDRIQCANEGVSTQPTPYPVATSGAVSLGLGTSHSCAVLDTGAVVCWGYGLSGQLGMAVDMRDDALPVPGIDDAVRVAGGARHTCAVHESGAVSCWGDDAQGQLGDGGGTSGGGPTPVLVMGVTDAVDVTAGSFHTCVLHAGGATSCWGRNDLGQVGAGTSMPTYSSPIATLLGSATAIDAGASHACAALSSGGVWCFGSNEPGQLGNGAGGTGLFSSTPVRATGIP